MRGTKKINAKTAALITILKRGHLYIIWRARKTSDMSKVDEKDGRHETLINYSFENMEQLLRL